MAFVVTDEHLRAFAQSLSREIDKYGVIEDKDFLQRQKLQVETLVALENEFRLTLIAHPRGPGVYKQFIRHICDVKRNILDARPYFRERQPVFTKYISEALRDRADKSLYRFSINFRFVRFALKIRKFPPASKIARLARQIEAARKELIEINMPLAINRARLFFSRTPKSHLEYMDLIQICAEGLISAVDKFCLPYSKVFRSVGIGRMVGNMIEEYSETTLHFFPSERRKIYRANKAMARCKEGDVVDWDKLAIEVNHEAKPEHLTNQFEIADLITAASCVSADASMDNDPESLRGGAISRVAAPADQQPDVLVEKKNALVALSLAMQKLPVVERKLLRMRGVTV